MIVVAVRHSARVLSNSDKAGGPGRSKICHGSQAGSESESGPTSAEGI